MDCSQIAAVPTTNVILIGIILFPIASVLITLILAANEGGFPAIIRALKGLPPEKNRY